VPEALHLQGLRLLIALGLDQFFRQLQDAVDMVVVNMADHQQVYGERIVIFEAARLSNLREPRLQVRPVDLRRPAVYQDEARVVLGAVV
jgi:hypothetical protein